MAKKTKKRKSGSRRRRVSGAGSDGIGQLAAAMVGAIGAKVLGDQLATNAPDLKPNMVIGGKIVIGGIGALKLKNPLLKALCLGMAAEGGIAAAQSFGVIAGLGNTNLVKFYSNPALNGLDNSIAGAGNLDALYDEMGNLSVIAGME